jgi:hypothetical protein
MSQKKSFFRNIFSHLWPHAVWDGIHSLIATVGGAAMIAAVVTLFQALRHHWDIWAIVAVFAIGLLMMIWANNLTEKKRTARVTSPKEHPVPMPAFNTVEEWNDLLIHLTPIMNRRFTHEQVILDGKQFVGCSFVHVNLSYNGTAPFSLQNCDFDEDTKKHFHSQSPAFAQWTELLRTLGMLREGLNFVLTPVEPPQ